MQTRSPGAIFQFLLARVRAEEATAPPGGEGGRRAEVSRWARSALPPVLLVAFFLAAIPVRGAVLDTSKLWPSDPATGLTEIPVCIADGSSTEVADKPPAGRRFDLDLVVGVARAALERTWESRSSIRFTGWGNCRDLTSAQRDDHVGLYIHPSADNNSKVGTGAEGVSSGSDNTSFNPWGLNNRCINSLVTLFRTTYVYSLDCVAQYAIHEFGHVIGLLHEWRHPETPAACVALDDGEELPVSSRSSGYIIPNQSFDLDSIMTYRRGGGGVCADVDGVRFGSEEPNSFDYQAVAQAYPPPVPVITSPLEVRVASGEPLRYRIEALHSPSSYGADFLHVQGLRVSSSTGLITGTPLAGIGGSIFIYATNEHGQSDPVTLRVSVGKDKGVEVRDGWLFVYGENERQGRDRIVVEQTGTNQFAVYINDDIRLVDSVVGVTVYGQNGDDDISVRNIARGVVIYGGPGDDVLAGGPFLDCLFGGYGQDRFVRSGASCNPPSFIHPACAFRHTCNVSDFADLQGSETWQAPEP